jgi:hypothetical protein
VPVDDVARCGGAINISCHGQPLSQW